MLSFLQSFLLKTWQLVAEMAPYLLFGFAVAGVLHILIRQSFIRGLLGRPGAGSVVKASLLGVPMPLCSCSVIPVAASLRRSGASRGATASFLSSTPQTGVDSILATYALMGGIFTATRVGVAFVCGIVSGLLIDRFAGERTPETNGGHSEGGDGGHQSDGGCCHGGETTPRRSVGEVLRYGFITLPADLASALILGLLLAGLISALLPPDLLTGHLSSGPLAFFLATAVSLPLYVCATGSIPMAFALIAAGLSPGAALVFLITGPATNTATIATVWKMLGRQATAIYLSTLVVIAWLAGWLLNALLFREIANNVHAHEALQPALWQHAAGALLVAVLIYSIHAERKKAAAEKADAGETGASSCCGR